MIKSFWHKGLKKYFESGSLLAFSHIMQNGFGCC